MLPPTRLERLRCPESTDDRGCVLCCRLLDRSRVSPYRRWAADTDNDNDTVCALCALCVLCAVSCELRASCAPSVCVYGVDAGRDI